MAKREKKVSIATMDKIMKENFENVVTKDYFGAEVVIRRNLSLEDSIKFVNTIVANCFGDDGDYMPEAFEFVYRSEIVTRYSNVSLPDSADHRYELLYNTNIVKFIEGEISHGQLCEIRDAAQEKIGYLCDVNASEITKQVMALIESFEAMQEKTAEIYKGIDPSQFSGLLNAFKDGKVDEEKIVRAYMSRKTGDDK